MDSVNKHCPFFYLEANMVMRLKLTLEQPEYSALLKVATDELRNPVDQARFIIREELERRGFLLIEKDIQSVGSNPPASAA